MKFIEMDKIYENILNYTRNRYGKYSNCSLPVIAEYNGKYVVSFFIYTFTKEEAKGGFVKPPCIWLYCDIFTGDIIYINEFDSTLLSYAKSDILDITKPNISMPAKNYKEKCLLFIDNIRKDICLHSVFYEKRYNNYWNYMISSIPKSFLFAYQYLNINIHTGLFQINTDTLLPMIETENQKEKIKTLVSFYQDEKILYVPLNKDSIRNSAIGIEAEPFTVCIKNKRIAFVTHTYYTAVEIAKKYKLYQGEIPLIGILIYNDKYGNLTQFLKYMNLSYAESIMLGIHEINGRITCMATCHPTEFLTLIGENANDLTYVSLESRMKQKNSNEKPKKYYPVLPQQESLLNDSIDPTGGFPSQKDSSINTNVSNITNRVINTKEALNDVGFIYILSNFDTDLPFLNQKGYMLSYTNRNYAEEGMRKIMKSYKTHINIICLYQNNYESTFSYLSNTEGILGLVLDDETEIIVSEKCDKNAVFKKNMTLLRQAVINGNEDEIKKREEELLISSLGVNFYIPMVYSISGKLEPIPLQTETKETIFHAYTENNELLKTGIEYDTVINLKGHELSLVCDKLLFNPSSKTAYEIDMKNYVNLITVLYFTNCDMEFAQRLLKYPQVIDEFSYVMKNKKFKKEKAVKADRWTIESLCRNYKINAVSAFKYLIELSENPNNAYKLLNQEEKR